MSEATFYYGMVAVYGAIIVIIMGIAKKITVMDDEFFIRRVYIV